jgi:hypothetical protein
MRFFRSDSGYALVLTLLFMPVFIGMSLLVIDISRGNNAHSDLQAAADALALAGARELDGGVTSIDRAIVAMSNVSNTVSFLGRTDEAAATALTFEFEGLDNPFTVVFLSGLPANDDTPLTQAFLAANAVTNEEGSDQGEARFVYVRAQSRDLSPFFGLFFEGVNRVTDVPVAAQAVATFRSAACDITPIFMCNPFELDANTDLPTAFARGLLHARLAVLDPSSTSEAGPGNFGFLRVNGTGAPPLSRALGSGVNATCYESTGVTTEPGATRTVISDFNQRFDIYPQGGGGTRYPPALNVRKGFVVPVPTNPGQLNNIANNDADFCGDAIFDEDNALFAAPYLQSPNAETITSGVLGRGGVDWPLLGEDGYWAVNHPDEPMIDLQTMSEISSFRLFENPDPAAIRMPSRYDIYRYEIEADLLNNRSRGDRLFTANETYNTEIGAAQCFPQAAQPTDTPDRRIINIAIIDCEANRIAGTTRNVPVAAYGSAFLASPMIAPSGDGVGRFGIEIIDIAGPNGNGTLDTFVRDEAILVR